MVCKICKCELGAIKRRVVVENDDSADKQTRVFNEFDMACKNKYCEEFNKVQETTRYEMSLG